MNKPGRNSPCYCNSGKKFKRCHGAPAYADLQQSAYFQRHEAREFQRREQQGLGRPIISAKVDEHRLVAVGNRLHAAKNWGTFHDFLRDYPRIALGEDWWQGEIQKSTDSQHRVVAWYTRACEQAALELPSDKVGTPSTGALSAYMHFAYDLYALKHSTHVESLLIERIKNTLSFSGATYEVRVAASFLRAGFTIEFEDETDRRSTHVEFVATHTRTGAKFSVEAKRREGARLRVNKLLFSALNKEAKYPRIVFIDTNDGRLEHHKRENIPMPLSETRTMLKKYAEDPIGRTLPAAYVIATHTPQEHHLATVGVPLALLLLGFHVDDLQPGYKNLLAQVEVRRRNLPVFELIESMSEHMRIPVSFDGEADVFATRQPSDKFQIGSRFIVTRPDGVEVDGLLESGFVMSGEKKAYCIFVTADGTRFMGAVPLTAVELEAYNQHPSTFFGTLDYSARRKPIRTEMDCFNFLWASYEKASRDDLLEWMKESADISDLHLLSQPDIATHYCVRMAEQMMSGMRVSAGYES
ncbi:YecA family protein [Pseudomonas sichuanensis]|uniref:YecA family protein n=1 Tax=Pseudomonas sichuanensis TaxID=2213015 RepID=UPI00215DFA03|nr:SEC-C metal-binding domain-containing protein [Pseudomonas sichuanensis]UVL89466.1 SEC-C domain-containing protein [Pseudomonas sichuanensis]